jgi:precorrin-2 methylase
MRKKTLKTVKKKIILCARGLKPGHLTMETRSALRSCDAVFTSCLDEESSEFYKKTCPGVVFRFLPVAQDPEKMADKIVREILADDSCGTAAYLTYGNTRFLSGPVFSLDKKAREAGLEVFILDGVSSVDSIVNMMDLNKFALNGLRLVNLEPCAGNIALTPDMDTCFFLVWCLLGRRNRGSFKKFLADLKRVYGAQAPAYLINCASLSSIGGKIVKTRVSKLGRKILSSDGNTTLLIPSLPASSQHSAH